MKNNNLIEGEELISSKPSLARTCYYILFGVDAIREYRGIKVSGKTISVDDAMLFIDEGTIEKYVDGVNTPQQLLAWAEGWNEHLMIGKDDYEVFMKAIRSNGDAPPTINFNLNQ